MQIELLVVTLWPPKFNFISALGNLIPNGIIFLNIKCFFVTLSVLMLTWINSPPIEMFYGECV